MLANQRRIARVGWLSYPGNRSGYNPMHVLGQANLSAVSRKAGTLTNLLDGRPGTINGGSISANVILTGHGARVGTTSSIRFGNSPAPSNDSVTFACIVVPNSSVANSAIFDTDGAGTGGNGFGWQSASLVPRLVVKPSFTNVSSGITLSVGVPYFIAASCNSSASNHLVMRLDNGVISTSSTTGLTTPSAPNGTCTVGNFGATSNFASDMTYHAIMWSSIFSSKQALLLAASDPWSYWYPA